MGFLSSVAGVLKRNEGHDVSAWLALARSYNGYERQAAVEALQRLRDVSALPMLLARANDWVPPVRCAAQSALRSFMDDAYARDWVQALDSVVALERAQRVDHRELLASIAAFLSRPTHLAEVVAASVQAASSVQRYVFALQYRQAQTEEARFGLLRQALVGADVVLAESALAKSAAVASPSLQQALTDAACRARYASVRAEGLRRALAAPQAATPSLVRAMCLDGSAAVRTVALRALQTQGSEAVDAAVADALARLGRTGASGKEQAVALQFVGAARPAQALAYGTQALQSPSAELRRVAFSTLLSHVQGDAEEPLLLSALADPSSKVQRLVTEHVRRGGAVPPASKVLDAAWVHGMVGALSRAFSILGYCPTWSRLEYLLQTKNRVWPSPGEALFLAELERWASDARHNFVEPTVMQRSALRVAWQGVAASIPVPLRQRVEFHLLTSRVLERGAITKTGAGKP